MHRYTWEELVEGMSHQFEHVVTQGDMDLFRSLSQDTNPLHCDPNYALQRGFPGCVVYGMLLSSFYSRLAGVYLPGEKCLLHGVDVQFVKPAFVGDRLRISGEITYRNEAYKQIWIHARIFNQNGDEISKAKIKAGVMD